MVVGLRLSDEFAGVANANYSVIANEYAGIRLEQRIAEGICKHKLAGYYRVHHIISPICHEIGYDASPDPRGEQVRRLWLGLPSSMRRYRASVISPGPQQLDRRQSPSQ